MLMLNRASCHRCRPRVAPSRAMGIPVASLGRFPSGKPRGGGRSMNACTPPAEAGGKGALVRRPPRRFGPPTPALHRGAGRPPCGPAAPDHRFEGRLARCLLRTRPARLKVGPCRQPVVMPAGELRGGLPGRSDRRPLRLGIAPSPVSLSVEARAFAFAPRDRGTRRRRRSPLRLLAVTGRRPSVERGWRAL